MSKGDIAMKVFLFLSVFLFSIQAGAESLVLYTTRSTDKLKALIAEFEASSGATVEYVPGTHQELLEKHRGTAAPRADLFLTKDIVYLNELERLGVYQPMESQQLKRQVPANFRHPGGLYTLLSFRARVAMIHKSKVAELESYEDLAGPEWKGRLCLRSGENSYNVGLVAGLLERHGEEKTRAMLSGWLGNLAAAPIDSDTNVLKAIRDGKCDVGITNTYYLAALLEKDPEFPVRPVFLSQGSTGSLVNGYGIGVVKGSRNPALATRLVEFLTGKLAQERFTAPHFEYPVNPEALPVPLVQGFGRFNIDNANLSRVGARSEKALELIRSIGYR